MTQPFPPSLGCGVNPGGRFSWVSMIRLMVSWEMAVGALVWGSASVPVVESAGNPLYLHGTGVSPAITAVSAAPPPRYGTCTMFTPARALNNSAAKNVEVPAPADA